MIVETAGNPTAAAGHTDTYSQKTKTLIPQEQTKIPHLLSQGSSCYLQLYLCRVRGYDRAVSNLTMTERYTNLYFSEILTLIPQESTLIPQEPPQIDSCDLTIHSRHA